MRKYLGLLIVLLPLLVLTSCNLISGNIPQPTSDQIATQVSVNLTQTAVSVPPTQPPTVPPPTQAPTSTKTIPPSTATPTPTLEPTATTPPGDPKLSLGTPKFKDNFANGKSWGLDSPYDDGNTRVEITDNAMVLTSYKAVGWHGWRVSYLKPKNFYLEATIKTGTCSSNDFYGLIFRSPDNSAGYWFGVSCDGQYNLRKGDTSNFANVIQFQQGDAILAGSNQTNRLGVMANGDKISLYANGKLLGEVTDTTYPDGGTYGLFIVGWKTPNFSISCTELAYWELP